MNIRPHPLYLATLNLLKLAQSIHCDCLTCDSILRGAELARAQGWKEND